MITSALFEPEDDTFERSEIDAERLKNDETYREEILLSMSARQSRQRKNRRLRLMIYILAGSSLFSAGVLTGGYMEPFIAEMVVLFVVSLIIVPLMGMMLINIRKQQ